jgi:DNA-binding response OmpR family regulator
MPEARKKILCIEDDRETAKLIANELSERGFYALIAYDARVGLAAILKRIPDLVLCDVGLPEMSGFELLATVSAATGRSNRIPFIFLTGWTGREHELHGRSLGADDYINKPIDFDILDEIIRARLVRGVVRHEMALKAPPLPRGATRRALSKLPKRGVEEQIVELIDAPTVDLHLEQAHAMADSGEGEALLKVAPHPITES